MLGSRAHLWCLVLSLLAGCAAPIDRSEALDGSALDGPALDGSVRDGSVRDASTLDDASPPIDLGDGGSMLLDASPMPEGDAGMVEPPVDPPEPPEPPEPPDVPEPPDPPLGPVERTYRVLHWNVAGAKIHRGRTDTGLIPVLSRAIRDSNAHFVGLNELCRSQFDALVRSLRGSGWPDDPDRFARFVAARPGSITPGSCGAFGSAIFSRLPLGAAERFELPSDGTVEGRWLICAPLPALPHMRFCTTHLTPTIEGGHNRAQLREAFRRIEAYRDRGDTVIVTGDFNTEPDAASMDAVYAPGVDTPNNRNNTGEYRELDDDDATHCRGYGERTGEHASGGGCGNGRKIDFIFVRRDRIVRAFAYSADSHPLSRECSAPGTNLCADHRRVTGRVRVRIER